LVRVPGVDFAKPDVIGDDHDVIVGHSAGRCEQVLSPIASWRSFIWE
jgi:hypothetical protein